MDKIDTPEDLYGELFYDVHRQGIFTDGKQFADARAKLSPALIMKYYLEEREKPGFDLKTFVYHYFELDTTGNKEYDTERKPIEKHLHGLWQELKREPDKKSKRDSKLPLPYPYIVPGGRFNEIYYWDSYFTMLGLRASGEIDIIEHMVNNFRYLISTYGHIPNGNRTYFLSRSQPPFYSLMVKLLIELKGNEIIKDYLPSLVAEYNFWMKGTSEIRVDGEPYKRVVKIDKTLLLNRYFDEKDTPREEMYGDDWSMIQYKEGANLPLFRHLRSACESGWDFSSRWLKDPMNLDTIEAYSIIPIDLNCLLWHLEKLISECYNYLKKDELSLNYGILAVNRKKAIESLFWDENTQFFYDWSIEDKHLTLRKSLAGVFPLFFGLATDEQAKSVTEEVKNTFLKDGGVVTTPYETGQQWDAPNGWAPLQWITIQGLRRYGYKELAREIAFRWTNLNRNVYFRTGKMLEKYNVVDTSLEGGGGEYPVQDGFGWTNGVYLALTQA